MSSFNLLKSTPLFEDLLTYSAEYIKEDRLFLLNIKYVNGSMKLLAKANSLCKRFLKM